MLQNSINAANRFSVARMPQASSFASMPLATESFQLDQIVLDELQQLLFQQCHISSPRLLSVIFALIFGNDQADRILNRIRGDFDESDERCFLDVAVSKK